MGEHFPVGSGPVAQLADAKDLKSLKCGFKSHRGYEIGEIVAGATCGDDPRVSPISLLREKQVGQYTVDGDEIENRFGFHPATDETREKHLEIREAFIELGKLLVELLPESREKSLAFTALQEASMWSNAAVACNLAPLKLGE